MVATSAARVTANQNNAQRSTGPKTAEGKARARANAVKHGLTGAGIALPTEEAAAVEARFTQLQIEMAPSTLEGALLVREIALMSVRIDRAALQEAAALALAVRHAAIEFDLASAAEIDRLYATIETNPFENRRRLLTTLEGTDRLVAALQSARDQVVTGAFKSWTPGDRRKVDAFLGGDYSNFPVSQADALMMALLDRKFAYLAPDSYHHLPKGPPRRGWARQQLLELIETEIARLIAHRLKLDEAPALHDADRGEAAARAIFALSPEAILARKYEASARRALAKARRDFADLETQLALDHGPSIDPGPGIVPQPESTPLFCSNEPNGSPLAAAGPTELEDCAADEPEFAAIPESDEEPSQLDPAGELAPALTPKVANEPKPSISNQPSPSQPPTSPPPSELPDGRAHGVPVYHFPLR